MAVTVASGPAAATSSSGRPAEATALRAGMAPKGRSTISAPPAANMAGVSAVMFESVL